MCSSIPAGASATASTHYVSQRVVHFWTYFSRLLTKLIYKYIVNNLSCIHTHVCNCEFTHHTHRRTCTWIGRSNYVIMYTHTLIDCFTYQDLIVHNIRDVMHTHVQIKIYIQLMVKSFIIYSFCHLALEASYSSNTPCMESSVYALSLHHQNRPVVRVASSSLQFIIF